MHAKVQDRTGQPVVHRTLVKTSDEWLSRVYSIHLDRSFTVDGGQLQPMGGVTTTPQKILFGSVNNHME